MKKEGLIEVYKKIWEAKVILTSPKVKHSSNEYIGDLEKAIDAALNVIQNKYNTLK